MKNLDFLMFFFLGPCVHILVGESGLASTFHFSITLPHSNENVKVSGYFLQCMFSSLEKSLRGRALKTRMTGVGSQDLWVQILLLYH